MRQLTVAKHEAGQRLDKLLAKYLDLAPKSFLYKMLRKKNITLNGKKAAGSEKVQEGDEIRLFLSEETIGGFMGRRETAHTQEKLDILYENRHVMFVNKPRGMLSQRAKKEDVSMVEHVLSHLLRSGEVTEEMLLTFRPSVCSRLDRNTSGVLAAGKTLYGLQAMAGLLRERRVRKLYLCIVSGVVHGAGECRGWLCKDELHNRVQISDRECEGAKFVHTRYRPLADNGEDTLLEAELLTGRAHQIRAQLALEGHPLFGDEKYGKKETNRVLERTFGLRGQLLHAYCLEFPELAGELSDLSGRRILAPVPEVFLKIAKERGLGKWLHGVPEG